MATKNTKDTKGIFGLVVALIFWGLVGDGNVFGDLVRVGGKDFAGVTVVGVGEGGIVVRAGGVDKVVDPAKLERVEIDGAGKFNEAEKVRDGGDVRKAAALYKEGIREINDEGVKRAAELRAVGVTAADGKWTEAVGLFLAVYAGDAEEGIWKARPTEMPGEGSSMLVESAKLIEAKAGEVEGEEAKRNLKVWAMEIYGRGKDPRAQVLARELGGTGEETRNAKRETRNEGATLPAVGVEEVQWAIKGKDFLGAIRKADVLLEAATGDGAIQLFILKAVAYQGLGNGDEAASCLVRVAVHYPASATAPDALWQAGVILKKERKREEEKALCREILEKYPDSPAAVRAKGEL